MDTTYDTDVVAWAEEQVALLKAGHLSRIDVDNIAEEIADVGMNIKRELASRMEVLVAHLLKWEYQPGYRSRSWRGTINLQRIRIARDLQKMPSLRRMLQDEDWLAHMYNVARTMSVTETNLVDLPREMPWSIEQVLDPAFPADS